ncbi:class I SAM-dependent methyltransferase [Paenibacillus sp. OAS669]|uniref:class I SAM-dependent methyltransferase n=1 Tax=Paenibacillus sp. OAS669 TaxID=2663821 RepID=UPI00178A8801|nr:class I SAM-dependent methyltransferase [Paenibacillus sp. OAS669]MBE1443594.1 ubiquinone/menaquinone biosynthesis C-methylase UbiE [Paenibacillus sp. OAS669]
MKENKYDDPAFFQQYSQMARSMGGLDAAGEWHAVKRMLPDLRNQRVLDLGCGYGWHCRYAIEQGAKQVTGVDISERMLREAKRMTQSDSIQYLQMPIEDIDFPENSFDVVFSSLAFHYIQSFEEICRKVNRCLTSGGAFVFSVEHPVFTAHEKQDWHYDELGQRMFWPVDRYFAEGMRHTRFLGEKVTKYHRTLTTYINQLIRSGFQIRELVEPEPDSRLMDTGPEMKDELRRPMFLLISAIKL